MRTERRPTDFQSYWRCAHHPSCIDNFFAERKTCEWECHTQTLKPYHGGFQPPPKSWPAMHDRRGSASAIQHLP